MIDPPGGVLDLYCRAANWRSLQGAALSTCNELFQGLGDGGFLGPLAADSQGALDKLRVDG